MQISLILLKTGSGSLKNKILAGKNRLRLFKRSHCLLSHFSTAPPTPRKHNKLPSSFLPSFILLPSSLSFQLSSSENSANKLQRAFSSSYSAFLGGVVCIAQEDWLTQKGMKRDSPVDKSGTQETIKCLF